MNIPMNYLSKLTDEQKKRVEAAKTPEELRAIAKEAGCELTQSQLEALSGGWCFDCANNVPGPCGADFNTSCSPYCDALV